MRRTFHRPTPTNDIESEGRTASLENFFNLEPKRVSDTSTLQIKQGLWEHCFLPAASQG
jgi:hypothetical protein